MSGEINRNKYHKHLKNKKNAAGENVLDKQSSNGQASNKKNNRNYKENGGSSSSGLCVKLVFFVLLSTFTLVGTLVFVDYQPGQLKEAYETQIPPEVRLYLDDGLEKAHLVWNVVQNITTESWNNGQILARTWTRAIKLGNVTLEEILFSDEIRQEQHEHRKQATDKLKATIDLMNKKIQEEKEKSGAKIEEDPTGERTKREAEEKIQKEKEEKLKQEQEAKRLAEEKQKQEAEKKKQEELKKAEEEKARLELEKKKKEEEARLQKEKEEKLKQEAETKRLAEEKQKQEAEAKRLAEEKLKQEAEKKKQEELKKAEEEKAKLELEKKKKEEEEKLQKEKEEKLRQQEAEAKRLAGEKQKQEAEAKRLAEEKLKQEAERKKQEELQKAEEEKAKLELEKKKKEEEAKLQKEKEEKLRQEAEAKRLAEEKLKQEAEKKKQEELKKAEEEKARLELEKKKKEEEAKLQKEKEEKLKQEAEAKRLAEEKLKQEAEKKKQEELKKAEEEKARLELEKKKKEEEAKLQKEKEEKLRQEAEAKRLAEEKLKQEAEKKKQEELKKAEEEKAKLQKEKEENLRQEAEKKKQEELKKAEEERQKKEEEVRLLKEQEDQAKKDAEAKRLEEERQKLQKQKLEEEKQNKVNEAKLAKEKETVKQQESAEPKKDQQQKTNTDTEQKKDKGNDENEEIHSVEPKDQLDDLELQVMFASSSEDPVPQLKALLHEYDTIIASSLIPSPRALFGKAHVLDILSQELKSNELLEQSIELFKEILQLGPSVPPELFLKAGQKCSDLMEFRGWTSKAIIVQKVLADKFPDSVDIKNKLGLLYMLTGNDQTAKSMFQSVLEKSPSNSFAAVHLGFILKSQGTAGDLKALEDGVALLKAGLAKKEKEVLDGKFFVHLGDGLRRLGKTQEADLVFQDGAELALYPSFWQRSLYNVEGLKSEPLWTIDETQIGHQLANVRNNWEIIRNEALAILRDETQAGFTKENENLADTGRWAQFELYRQGFKNDKNCLRAPFTCALIDSIPDIKLNRRGQVKFSVMYAGTHAFAHSGPTNCRLRAHLGLSIPHAKSQPKNWTGLRVADKFVTWNEGEMFIFDDSFDHEVWNESDERLVLIMDMWHPQLSKHLKDTLPAI